MNRIFFPAACILVLLASFQSTDKISFQVSSPAALAAYPFLDTVWIKAVVDADEALHNVTLKVISLKDSAVLYKKNIHTHGIRADISEYFINPMPVKTSMKLIIQTTDHDGRETGIQEVVFSSRGKKK